MVTNIHKGLAYLIMIAGFGAIYTGVYDYRSNPKHPFDLPLEWIHLGCTLFIFGGLEVLYQFL